MMFTFSERDNTLSDSSLQVFMLEKISASISSTLKDFVTLNVTLIPYNIYALVDDFCLPIAQKRMDHLNYHTG